MLRVLVVDDSPVARGLLTAILDGEDDIEVIGEACNGQEAVDCVFSTPSAKPHVILMDLHMPVMDGITATKILRKRGYEGLIYAVTASVVEDTQQRINAVWRKPLRKKQLLKRFGDIVTN